MSATSTTGPPGLSSTPRELGYHMPPEWYPHHATWLAWPTDPTTWPNRLPQVERIYIQMIGHLTEVEQVCLLVDDSESEQRVRQLLKKAQIALSQVHFFVLPTADAWIRDYGPNFLIRDHGHPPLAFNDWGFNAWGDKYQELKKDNRVPACLSDYLRVPRFQPGMILEGGSIDVNGRGTLLTTEQCLLNPNRNPSLNRDQLEQKLKDYLNVTQIIWLGEGIAGDDTDGHIDDVARFVSSDTIVCCREEDPGNPNFEVLQENWSRLSTIRSPWGEPFNVIALPMPKPVQDGNDHLPASYANFYIANQMVLLPTFGQPNDRIAQRVLQQVFPHHKVVGIGCEPLLWGLGAIHCVTQQQPRVA